MMQLGFSTSAPLCTPSTPHGSFTAKVPMSTPRRVRVQSGTKRTITGMIRLPWSPQQAPETTLNFNVGYAYLANPEKNTSEDAFFVEGNAAGVFDGVSGAYASRGVDPRRFSQNLAALTQAGVRADGPGAVVKAVYAAAEMNTEIGASTACVVGMDGFGRLTGINLGDSGVRIVRGNKMVFRTKEQQHFFNCPYQLSSDGSDYMAMGQNVLQKAKKGDWIILASDGLYDNVEDKDIVAIASEASDPFELADKLADIATDYSYDKNRVSPFERAATKAGQKWKGGKLDDLTIVALRVVDEEMQPQTLLSILPETEEEAGAGAASEVAAEEVKE